MELECIERMYLNAYVPHLTSHAAASSAALLAAQRRTLGSGGKVRSLLAPGSATVRLPAAVRRG
jgi:hypothetical protein